jgi:hypothetical protein
MSLLILARLFVNKTFDESFNFSRIAMRVVAEIRCRLGVANFYLTGVDAEHFTVVQARANHICLEVCCFTIIKLKRNKLDHGRRASFRSSSTFFT